MDITTMRTWAEVDLDAITHNYQVLRQMIGPNRMMLGLCKANGYGHGGVRIGQKLEQLGVDMLAVACLEEAIELRQGGVKNPILCLGYTDPAYTPQLLEYSVTQTVGNLESGEAMSKLAVEAGKTLKIHVKLDTGMSRLGFLCQEGVTDEIAKLCRLPGLEAEGFYTHFADSGVKEDYTRHQLAQFQNVIDELDAHKVHFKIFHCANSGAVLNYPYTYMDMVRPGLLLYGYYPDDLSTELTPEPLRPALKLKSRITAVRKLPKGTPVSYGCMEQLKRDSVLAVVPIGYGDGYPRFFSAGMEMLVGGKRCPIVGRVCMDMCMVDVTEVPDVKPMDVAVVYGEDHLLDDAAKWAGTITYELLCMLNSRVPRIYIGS